jgi:hypothetical protein
MLDIPLRPLLGGMKEVGVCSLRSGIADPVVICGCATINMSTAARPFIPCPDVSVAARVTAGMSTRFQ